MLNYTVDPSLLLPLVPRGTELDTFNGLHTVSLVAFHFRHTRVCGVPVPFHRFFEEVNLRFYVSRQTGGEMRRGVVFIRELVPRTMIALVARTLYNEPYRSLPMGYTFQFSTTDPLHPERISFHWGDRDHRCSVDAAPIGDSLLPESGSEAEFITEHYWGYTRQPDGSTKEYRVEHPRWNVWTQASATISGPHASHYEPSFAQLLNSKPRSVLVADGSPVRVFRGARI